MNKEKKLKKRYVTLQNGKIPTPDPETEELFRQEQRKLM